jgi:putative HD superfamily hydrolase of NAD metabolism
MMDTADFRKIQKKLYKKLDSHRYQHTLGVMYTCAALAMVHGVDLGKAQTAGLLHDCAKCIPNEKKLKLCKKHEIPVTPFEKENPFLIHAKLGAYLARKKYKVEDEEILSAIRCHTTGKEAMTALEQIVFIADYIEPTRSTAPHLERLRRLAFQDLDQCTYEILRDTLTYLRQSPQKIDETTERAYGYYRERNEKRHG